MTVPVPGQLVYSDSGDGVTTTFSFPVRFLDKAEVVVLLRDVATGVDTKQVLGSDYTIAGSSWPTGGNIVFNTPPPVGTEVIRYRETVAKQVVDLANTQRNDAEAVETQLDRLAMVQQDQKQELARALKADFGEDGLTVERVAEGHFWLAGPGGRMVDGGSAEDIINAQGYAAEAKDAADRAESAAAEVEYPVSYAPQTLTPEQQEQARENIGITRTFNTLALAQAYSPLSAPDYIQTAGYSAPGDGGGALYKKVVSEPSHAGKFSITLSGGGGTVWYELVAVERVNVKWFGAVGDGVTNDTTAIQNALVFAKSDLASGRYTGRTIFFPRGNYLVSNNAFNITDTIGLHLKGEGARLNTSYKRAATTITIDGTGSASGDYMFQFNANDSRNFVAEDIAFEYKNGFAGDLFRGSSPGMHFNRCSFMGDALGGPRPMTCENLIHFWEGHHYTFHACTFADALTHVFIDSVLGTNTNHWSFTGCSFYDTTGTWIRFDGPATLGLSITGCCFDPIQNNPTDGLILGCHGFDVSGNVFAGSSSDKGPTSSWIKVISGNGVIHGNSFVSNAADSYAIKIGSALADVRNNTFYSTRSILLEGAADLTGGNNRHIYLGALTTDIAILDQRNLSSFVDYGPDLFGTGYKNSYSIAGNVFTGGIIHYNANNDQSTDGPVYTASAANRGAVRLETHVRNTRSDAARQLTLKDAGQTFATAGTWTLPDAANSFAGMEIAFYKSTSNTGIVINAGAGTNIYDGATAANDSITNGTAEGGYIKFRCIDGTVWMVVEKIGTWA